ncbi:MAG: hypothetical protein EA402_02610 [Planctomycetota bacterium]|nr:MAG: hypothetical protein EA402_02610 [Planctomycetota bacterium]
MNSALICDAPGILSVVGWQQQVVPALTWWRRLLASGVSMLVLRSDEPTAQAMAEALPGASLHCLEGPALPSLAALARAMASVGADVSRSWMLSQDPQAFVLAAQIGCVGGVAVAVPAPAKIPGLVVHEARNLADVPRVMIPPQGGCWHDHDTLGA